MADVLAFPHDVFARWRVRHPEEARRDDDPRSHEPCNGRDCQTFAWRGYEGLCGWCFEEEEASINEATFALAERLGTE